ncbi:MAG: helix-turn-helix domain-containing protein [Eubacterium sp.]|nr:helix-turn-helix domain-containing protein [Eubacterium sp.]SEF54212.1 Transcriptional regulator, contains XRE-family HTH domain [Eubacterium ruminantium]
MIELDFKAIGKRIQHIRMCKGLTQEYVAQCADVNPSHISNIENNRVKISLTTLVNVCKAMDCTVDYILETEFPSPTALDNEIMNKLSDCSKEKKEKILRIIEIL